MDINEIPVTWTNRLTVVVVVWILEQVEGTIWNIQKSNDHVVFQIHTIVVELKIVPEVIFRLCVSVFNSPGNYPSFFIRDTVPLDV
jgi:hypothetical protein